MFVPPLHLAPLSNDPFQLPAKVIHNLVQSTRAIVNRGWYVAPTQQKVIFRAAQEAARLHTNCVSKLHKPTYRRTYDATSIMVHNQTPLAVGHAWHQRGYRVAVVNPTPLRLCHPSLLTSMAEQNILLRSAGLAECIFESGCYQLGHTSEPVVSPQLPIFRTHDGDLLNQPWHSDIITLAHETIDDVVVGQHVQSASMVHWLQLVMHAVQRVGANVLVFAVNLDVNADVLVQVLYEAFMRVKLHAVAAINIAIPDSSYDQQVWRLFHHKFRGVTISNT